MYELKTSSYPLEKYPTDADLLAKIKMGRSDPTYRIMRAGNFLAETVPAKIVQDPETGIIEDIKSAKVASWSVFIKNGRN